jgi:hypothetical protein
VPENWQAEEWDDWFRKHGKKYSDLNVARTHNVKVIQRFWKRDKARKETHLGNNRSLYNLSRQVAGEMRQASLD